MKRYFYLLLLFSCFNGFAQFAPQVGQTGTTAIHKDSSIIKGWASGCVLNKGWMDISDTSLGKTEVGDETYVPGPAGNGIVSLGDGGSAIVTFNKPIKDGPGWDFAVFENGFIDQTLKPGTAFLELAFVEVSSDGENYFRFPATSFIDTISQLESFEGIDAKQINNFAGKYLANYGTPFDLSELNNILELNTQYITHIKIIDVVGSITPKYTTRESNNRRVNDPWPTPFASGGFDLDAIGVIHQRDDVGVIENNTAMLSCIPNPIQASKIISLSCVNYTEVIWYNTQGEIILQSTQNNELKAPDKAGIYFVKMRTNEGASFNTKIMVW